MTKRYSFLTALCSTWNIFFEEKIKSSRKGKIRVGKFFNVLLKISRRRRGTRRTLKIKRRERHQREMIAPVRRYSTLILKPKKLLSIKKKRNNEVTVPARTRFAPSPTGLIHLGSLRTALYNYLLAKKTGGQFLLRLEDTDQKRLVKGAEKNIYESLEWCGLQWDEGPIVGGPYGPYRQSDRTELYKKYIYKLLENHHAYRCFCSKERLDGLRESAKKLQPPTTVSYDRHCSHLTAEESKKKASEGHEFTVRFRAPGTYPKFEDLLHGIIDMQPQVNVDDIRYDDPILMKSDGLPTYHFANVVDDHLMKITHVIRGEEWLPSTPKHIALYNAFGWQPPKFIHIPLLTSSSEKKLSKRSGDIDVMSFRNRHYLPEALVNFVALFGWSPPRPPSVSMDEIYTLQDLAKVFSIQNLTKGNAKVDYQKLTFFNKVYLQRRFDKNFENTFEMVFTIVETKYPNTTRKYTKEVVSQTRHHYTTIDDVFQFSYLFEDPDLQNEDATKFLGKNDTAQVISVLTHFSALKSLDELPTIAEDLKNKFKIPKGKVFGSLRLALTGSKPGLQIPILTEILGLEGTKRRIRTTIDYLSK